MTKPLYFWNGTTFEQVGPTVPQSPIAYQTSAPTGPATGDLWIDSDGDVDTYTRQLTRYKFVAQGGETSLSGADANNVTLAYTPGSEMVYLNGALLNRGSDYTATNGTSITNLNALLLNDIVEIFAYVSFNPANTYTQAETNALIQPSFRNLIINGAMQVAQRGTSTASITTDGIYTADRWNCQIATLGTWTQTVENDAPTGSGFRKSLKWLCTTADASPASGDYALCDYRFEGQNLQQIAKGTSSAKQLTLSFWVKSNVTGTYIVNLYDVDNTRVVCASYSVSASATWEKKTITFPADTTGAFDNDNGYSFDLQFFLAVGSSFSSGTLATTWGTPVSANRGVGQTNLASATNNYWQITGVQLEVGSTATPFEFLPAQTEIALCQRYYESTRHTTSPIFGIQAITNGLNGLNFMVRKRASATTKVYSSVTNVVDTVNNGNGNVQTNITSVASYIDSFAVQMAGTTSQMYTYYYVAEAEL